MTRPPVVLWLVLALTVVSVGLMAIVHSGLGTTPTRGTHELGLAGRVLQLEREARQLRELTRELQELHRLDGTLMQLTDEHDVMFGHLRKPPISPV